MPLIKSANVPASIAPFSMASIERRPRRSCREPRAEKAEQLLAEAQSESERLRRQAAMQGLTEGRKQGHAQGFEEGKKGHDQALSECIAKNSTAGYRALQRRGDRSFEQSRGRLESGACAR
jgi:flagellar biosynthesis/type III secretory pathway protein FliH